MGYRGFKKHVGFGYVSRKGAKYAKTGKEIFLINFAT